MMINGIPAPCPSIFTKRTSLDGLLLLYIIMVFTTIFPHKWVVPAITIGRLFNVFLKL